MVQTLADQPPIVTDPVATASTIVSLSWLLTTAMPGKRTWMWLGSFVARPVDVQVMTRCAVEDAPETSSVTGTRASTEALVSWALLCRPTIVWPCHSASSG